MERHDEAVRVIASSVSDFYSRKVPFRIYHGSTNSTRPLSFGRDEIIDTSKLCNVVHVDEQSSTALVEPNVPMDALVGATLAYGLVPPVVMEFPGITVGGGFAGGAAESSSFKHGMFDCAINWIEIVQADGELVKASSTERADLFHGAAGTFGTLGVVTLLEIRLEEAKKYVELTYLSIASPADIVNEIEKAMKDPSNAYIDGIVLAKDKTILMAGRGVNSVQLGVKERRFWRARDDWFICHVGKLFANANRDPVREAIPLEDYLFRYDRGAFWTGVYAFKYFITPFNRLTRWALDPFMRTRVMYQAMHAAGHGDRYIIQDLAIPQSSAQAFIEYIDEDFGIYPLWLCPIKRSKDHHLSLYPSGQSGPEASETMLNIGVWAPGPSGTAAFVDANRAIECKVRQLSGLKWLYAHSYYTREEFWSIYDREWYEALRVKYHATYLPDLYDKVSVKIAALEKSHQGIWRIWPLSGLYGIAKATVGGNYLLRRRWRTRYSILLFFLTIFFAMILSLTS